MAVVERKLASGVVFYVANRLCVGGSPKFERVGTDRRVAERRDAAMKREIARGRYVGKPTGVATVGSRWQTWIAARKTRTVDDEKRWWANHVAKRCPWFPALRLADVRYVHLKQLKDALEEPYVNDKGRAGTLTRKSIFNIFVPINAMFSDAYRSELIPRNPADWPNPRDHLS
ncbi:MAG TPA: hypothetical protein VK550_32970 [Polyangiaceae bacterium]|nr:hypothetical protein [Polyangiaceae bacterium]